MASQHKFTLKKGSKEFPDRFGGIEVTYSYPANYAELRQRAEAVLAGHTPKDGETKPAVDDLIYNLSMNQSGHLNIQKAIKARLDSDAENLKDLSVADRIADAVKYAEPQVVSIPGTRRGEGKGTKVARAEAKAEQEAKRADTAITQLEQAYLLMPKTARKTFAERLLEQGILTKERLAELDKQ